MGRRAVSAFVADPGGLRRSSGSRCRSGAMPARCCSPGSRSASLAVVLQLGGLRRARELREARRGHVRSASGSCASSRARAGSCSSPLIIPWVDAYSVWRGPTKHDRRRSTRSVFTTLSFAFPVPGEHGTARSSGCPTCSSSRSSSRAAARWRPARPAGPGSRWSLSLGATIALAVWLDVGGLPALPLLSRRLPAPERRPALARGQGSRRQRSPSKSDVTQA